MWSLHVFLVQSQPTCTVFPYPTLFRSEREQPAPLDRVGADRDQHRRQRLELQDARQEAQELGLAEHEEQAGAGGTRRNFLGLPRARLHRRLWLLQALVHGAQVLDLPRAALGVARRGHADSLTGRGMIQASYTTIARNTNFMTPKFAASTWKNMPRLAGGNGTRTGRPCWASS